MVTAPLILVVDDDTRNLRIIREALREQRYELVLSESGKSAWAWLQDKSHKPDAILLDRMMPGMDGLELLIHIKEDARLREVPVIFQTALSDAKSVSEGIHAGAYYYLTKPFDFDVLAAIVAAAVDDGRHYRRLAESVARANDTSRLLMSAHFYVRTLEQAEELAIFLAASCPRPSDAVSGLSELFVNAVEHGNLGITYEEKSRYTEEGTWRDEIAKRQAMPENRDKYVDITLERTADAIRFVVKDQGRGFDWQPFLEFNTERAFHTHGRGIAMARTLSFTELEYRGNGNEVVATISLLDEPSV